MANRVPSTGNPAASDKSRSTNVTIEEENLTIDLHQEFATVEVRYRMNNTGGQVAQDFFVPVERWTAADGEGDEEGGKPADLEDYRVTADSTELKWENVDVSAPEKEPASPTPSGKYAGTAEPTIESENEEAVVGDDFPPPTKHWKKSEVPFAANQTREVTVRYRAATMGTSVPSPTTGT